MHILFTEQIIIYGLLRFALCCAVVCHCVCGVCSVCVCVCVCVVCVCVCVCV